VIGGFTAPRGSRSHLGALLVGAWDGAGLRYAGKVGTGFTEQTLAVLHRRLAPLIRPASPFLDAPRARDVTWLDPQVVAQLGFTEMTSDGKLRHPVFLGLREDKNPRDVHREERAVRRATTVGRGAKPPSELKPRTSPGRAPAPGGATRPRRAPGARGSRSRRRAPGP